MPVITSFDATSESLTDLLHSVRDGRTQLPDFQRGWVWPDENIRSLLVSVSRGFPIGAVMTLQTGNPQVRFKPRLVEGVPAAGVTHPEPERLILDGQQRLTSLFQTLVSGAPVDTVDVRKQRTQRVYYIHIRRAIDPIADRDTAILSLPANRLLKNWRGAVTQDISSLEKECEHELLPVSIILDHVKLSQWQMRYLQQYPERMMERLDRWNALTSEVLQPIQQYSVPLIQLRKATAKEAVCQVFEKVNTGGVVLSVFELVTASFAAEDFNLRDDWSERSRQMRAHSVLEGVKNDDFLQAISLVESYERRRKSASDGAPSDSLPPVTCKRRDLLNLELSAYQANAERVLQGFLRAARFLHGQSLFTMRDLPYSTHVVPLAAIFALRGELAETAGEQDRLARWFWCGVFGELYGSAVESKFARDVLELMAWFEGSPQEPTTIVEATFSPARLRSMRSRNSAAYKGVHALVMRGGGCDFLSGTTIAVQQYFKLRMDVHHIFPKKWCKEQGFDRRRYDCVINKTPIAAHTNQTISSRAPSKYVPLLEAQAKVDRARMDQILASHLIDPSTLRADNFEQFFAARERALLDQIAQAMGKSTAPLTASDPVQIEEDDEDEDEDEIFEEAE